jgi:Raf kinase inhibitor-like YbhB/YbcL family protein
MMYEELTVTSDAFENGGTIPIQHTGRGEDTSPGLKLSGLSPNGKSIAIVMDDIDHPMFGIYNHWVMWNVPVLDEIPGAIPRGAVVETLDGAIQGNGYGKHRYRGPKPPLLAKNSHRYQFNVFVLNCKIDIGCKSTKRTLLQGMESHIIQYGSLIGTFKSNMNSQNKLHGAKSKPADNSGI